MRNKSTHSALRLGKGLALAALFTFGGLVPISSAQEGARPDQIFTIDKRGKAKTLSGVVETDGLSEVSVVQRDKSRSYDSASITRIVFGTVPKSYSDAVAYADKGDLENAVRKFRVAADDSDARDAVRAKARFLAGNSLMASAASAPENTQWSEVIAEFDRFLADYPSNRLVPTVRAKQARAKLLNGEPQLAGELGASIMAELDTAGKTAYGTDVCLEAAMDAAGAFLAAGDPAKARALFSDVERAAAAVLSDAEEFAKHDLSAFQARALMGEGFVLLAEKKGAQANTFFTGKLQQDLSPSARFTARLGFAETLLSLGKHRLAQIEFAAVSALDYTSRDNVAQALLGLIRCATSLPDKDSTERIAAWKESILTHFGDTPAASAVQ